MIIKIFETVAHDLRLKKERVENLENQDLDNRKILDKLKDNNEYLDKENQKLIQKLEKNTQEYNEQLSTQQESYTELQNTLYSEREKFKIDLERQKMKNRNLEIKFSQMEDDINDSRNEIELYKEQIKGIDFV